MSIERTARRRIHLIKRAELLKSIAEGCLCDGIDAPEPSSLPHAVKCAAKFHGLAANEEAERCLAAAAEVQEYWEGGAT
jgi:hypothetical protein